MPIKRVQKGRVVIQPKNTLTKPKPPIKTKMPKIKPAKKNNDYGASSITVLEGLEAVRKRPGMYIGSTGPVGLHHLIWEVMDNSIDEAMAGYCTEIHVKLLPDHIVEVIDNGRGIPVDIHPTEKVSALEVVMTKLHAGGKFGQGGYKVSGGLHGVGVSVVNALSSYCKAEIHRDGKIWMQEFKNGGNPVKKVKAIGASRKTGSTISFRPDETIFETLDFDWKTIVDHIRQQAYLNKGVRIFIHDKRVGEEKDKDKTAIPYSNPIWQFYFEGGIKSYIRHLNENKELKNENIFYIEKEMDEVMVEVALQYTGEYTETVFAFTNNIYNPEGGTHMAGFRTALTRSLNTYARNKNILKEKDPNLTGEDVREGLNAIISVKVREPQFEGQTKAKLGNTEVKSAVDTIMSEALLIFLEETPKDAEGIIGKCLLAARARNAAKIARDTILRKGALEGFTLPGKLADCSSRHAEDCELYIVEGDSAGGCFSADTKVAVADSRNLSFKELIKESKEGKQNYCYTITNEGDIGIEKIINPRLTKKKTRVIEITLDNNEKIVCTPEHKFMLRDGSYIEAKNLKPHLSLMPLRKKISERQGRITIAGYEMVLNPKTHKWIFTHVLSDEFRKKRKQSYNQTYLDHSLAFARKLFDAKKDIVSDYDIERKNLIKRNNNIVKLDTLIDRFFQGDKKFFAEAVANYNHKIKSIKKIRKPIDVYDIEVPNTHNFALASGIFVHNSAKQGRNRNNQAILPLRGKVLNVEKARLDKILSNNELKSLIIAMGTNIGEQFDITKLRYHRVVIMTDADVDGSHIRTLLLTFFYRYFIDLITNGHIYIAQPPLYGIKFGKDIKYVYTDEEKEDYLKELEKTKIAKDKQKTTVKKEEAPTEPAEVEEENQENSSAIKIGGVKVSIQRYKGLGEMDPEQLWNTTMDPEQRKMKRVTLVDAEIANQTFEILMGDEVAPRKKFIQTHAKQVQNLDI